MDAVYLALDEAQQADTKAALDSARGILRSEVGKNITVRLTPTLEFVADEIPVNASHLEELIREAKKRDEELAALKQGAAYAGDADPYRRDDDDDEEDLQDAPAEDSDARS